MQLVLVLHSLRLLTLGRQHEMTAVVLGLHVLLRLDLVRFKMLAKSSLQVKLAYKKENISG